MNRSGVPSEILIALLFLAGMVFVGQCVLEHNSPAATQPALTSGPLGIVLPPATSSLSCCDPETTTQPASTH